MASCTYAGQTSTFTYGADGLRRRMVTGTNTTDYLLDGQSVVRELTTENGQQTVTATYLVGPRGPEYERDGNGMVQWYLYDGLGSVVGLVDLSGNVTNTRKYDVYGAPRNAQTGSAHCFVGSLGHTSDAETGLIYMRARYMDRAAGRFVSEDPICDGPNWFVYADNDPVGRVDPAGEMAEIAVAYPAAAGLGLGCLALVGALLGVIAIAYAVHVLMASDSDSANRTAEEIISRDLKGSVNDEFPKELKAKTLKEIEDLAKKGDRAAIKAKKLLTNKRFKKGYKG
jgi:RHS repeat-associated protein